MSDRVTVEYKLRLSMTRPDPSSYTRFHEYATTNISDAFFKRQTLPHDIKPVYAGCPRIVGPAITAQVTPGDELLPLKAIEIARPGDVIVAVGAYSPRFSLWGGVMSTMAKARGVVGLITDGLVRDVDETRRAGFAVYAAVQERIAKEQGWHKEIQRSRSMILKETVDKMLAARSTHIEP